MGELGVLGLDLAAANSGLCFAKITYPEYSYSVTFSEGYKHPTSDFRNRVAVANEILCVAQTYNPDVVVIEDYAKRFGRTNTSGYEHAEVGGMVKKLLYEAGFLLYLIPPTSMRSYMEAPPRSPKNFLEEKALERFGFVSDASNKVKRSNITDAFIHTQIGAFVYLLRNNHDFTYDFSEAEYRILHGDGKKIDGLVYRSNLEYERSEED